MPLVSPDLDQRNFEQLLTEVRRRIPSFTPEWTDLNDSDPGITLAQLFAFMAEQLLFQVNQVPDKGLVTFLKLVGAELHPATPAIADITFFPQDSASFPALLPLTRGTGVRTSGPPPGSKEAINFETTKSGDILNGELALVASRNADRAVVSHLAANSSVNPGASFLPFGAAESTANELLLGFRLFVSDPSAAWPPGTIRLRFNLKNAFDVGDPPPSQPTSDAEPRIEWGFCTGTLLGGTELSFTGLQPLVDSTNEFTRSGYVELAFNTEQASSFIRAPATVQPDLLQGLFIIRAKLLREDAYSDVGAPALSTIRLNTFPAQAVNSVRAAIDGSGSEFLGGSSGLPFQRFRLANAPVVPNSARLRIVEPGGEFDWHETSDIFTAGPEDRVFQLFPATGDLLFGDGSFGRIPPPDDGSIPGGNIRVVEYQFGGGISGNVGAETLTNVLPIESALPSFDATNVLPAALGADEEPVDRGIARAPAVIRSRFRAVSAEDFAALAQETPDVRVGRAFALANTRPQIRPGMSPGSVTIKLVPEAPFEATRDVPILVQPSVAAAVIRYLDQRRLITTEIFAESASYRKVTVDAELVVEAGTSLAGTRASALTALSRFFHPLVGGPDGQGWPFGGTIFFSRVFEVLVNLEGVGRVSRLLIALDDDDFRECEDLTIQSGELLFSGPHQVTVGVGT